jgi:hypothetical protein
MTKGTTVNKDLLWDAAESFSRSNTTWQVFIDKYNAEHPVLEPLTMSTFRRHIKESLVRVQCV